MKNDNRHSNLIAGGGEKTFRLWGFVAAGVRQEIPQN